MNILKSANEIVNERSEEKARQYGPFIECNRKAAEIASILCGKEITTEDIYQFQIALKLARESHSHKEDNLLDLVAYIGALNNFHNGIEPGDIPEEDPQGILNFEEEFQSKEIGKGMEEAKVAYLWWDKLNETERKDLIKIHYPHTRDFYSVTAIGVIHMWEEEKGK